MRSKTLIMIALAGIFGVLAVVAGGKWLDRQAGQRLQQVQVIEKPVSTRTLVVAALPLRFGMEVTRQHLREVPWPGEAVPRGAFSTVDEILDGKTRRVALAAVEENEPVLAAKITGPGQRAALSAVIAEGLRAVTIRVNDVYGVAGFILPGERVDVLLTRNLERTEAFADVIIQNVRVLAVDQSADERSDKPAVVKAVTLEVDTAQAQKLSLAATVGTLSLALRAAGVAGLEATQRVALDDLARPGAVARAEADKPAPGAVQAALAPERTTTQVGVIRGMKRQDYSVPVDARP